MTTNKISKCYMLLILTAALFINFIMLIPAYAHSPIENRMPSAGEILENPPSAVDLWFEEPVEVHSGSILVHNSRQVEFQVGKPELDTNNQRHVTIALEKDLPAGKYTVYIDVIGFDGHPIRENYQFEVKAPQISQDEMFQKLKLEQSNPEDGMIVQSSPDKIELWFTQPAKLSFFGLLDDQQHEVTTKAPYQDPKNPKHFIIEMDKELGKGTYSAHWMAEVGEKKKYETFYFAVKEVSSIVGESDRPGESLIDFIRIQQFGYWLAFLGVLSLAGGTWFQLLTAKEKGNHLRWRKFSYMLYGLSFTGFLLEFTANRFQYAHVTFKDFIAFQFVWIPLLQMVLLFFSYWMIRGKLRLLFLSLAVLLWAFNGHSASASYGGVLGIGINALHLFAVSVWLGGLLALFIMAPKDNIGSWLKEAGKAYSKWALLSMIVIGITGVWMVLQYVPSFTMMSMAISNWGKIIYLKIFLFSAIIIFGYVQRKSLQRIVEHNVIPFLARTKIELMLAVVLLFAAAVLIDLSPTEAEQGIYPEQAVQNGVEAKVDITPFRAGASDITIQFENASEYEQVRAKFTVPPSWSVENTAFALGGGKYRVTGNFLHGAGPHILEIQAIRANGEKDEFRFKVMVPGVMYTAE